MSNPRLVRSLAMFAAVLALIGPAAARAEDTAKEAEGVGEAAIVNGDEAGAKEKAKKAALRDALEKTMGTYVAASSESKDFQSVSEHVMTATEGYIKSYDVVDTKKDGDAITVKVKAVVDKGHIDQDMLAKKLTIQAMKFPRLALLIAEQGINESSPSVSWGPQGGSKQGGAVYTTDERLVENTLIDEWMADGFTFVDMEALSGKLKAANVVNANPGSMDPRTIANLTDADYIIMGTAIAKNQGNLNDIMGTDSKDNAGKGMTSCKGLISARIFNTDAGEILATQNNDKTVLHIDPLVCGHNALKATAKVFADELKAKVLKSFNTKVNGGSKVRLVVASVPARKALKDFEAAVKEIRGVQSVDEKTFANNKADIDLRVEGGTDAVADEIDGKKYGTATVKVTGTSSNTITVELK